MAKYNSVEAYKKKIDRYMSKSPAIMKKGLTKGANIVRKEVITKHLGQGTTSTVTGRNAMNAKLRSDTGLLRSSIGVRVQASRRKSLARVGSGVGGGRPVKYAPIHEYGGTIQARGSGYLKFKINGQWYQKKSVHIPARPYLKPSLETKQQEALKVILQTLINEYRRA